MTVYLIRHGKTEGNALHRYIGRTDEPLCPQGVAEAERTGGNSAVNKVYVTPLLRTRQTAEILFPNARQKIIPALREMDFGIFENRSADDMESDSAYRAWVETGCLGKCPGGESMAEFSRRVCTGFAEVLAHREAIEVFVVHGGTIMSVLEQFGRPQRSSFDYRLKNCQGFRCTLASGEGKLPFTLTDITPMDEFRSIGKE